MSDTTYKHLGNLLSNCSDKELQEVLQQFMKKQNMNKEKMLQYFSDVCECKDFLYDGIMIESNESDCKNMEISPLTVIKCKERWQLERLSEMGLRFSGTKRLEENMNVYPCWVFIEREGHVNFSTDPAYVMKAVKEECFTICEFSDLVTKSIKQSENQEIKTDNGWYHINDVKPDNDETVLVVLERRARPGVSYSYDIQESVYRCGYPKDYFIDENDAWHVRYWRRETLIPYPNGVVSTEIAECKKNKMSPSQIIEHQRKCGIEVLR